MIDRIRVYNVGFGDSFLLFDESHRYKMMVDCGSATPSSCQIQTITTDLSLELSNPNSTTSIGMVTHFHSDHCNQILNLQKDLFDEFCLPNFFSRQEIKFFLIAAAYLGKRSPLHQFAVQLLQLIPGLVKNQILKPSCKIHFVKRGDTICDNIKILWPEPPCLKWLDDIIDKAESNGNGQVNQRINSILENYSYATGSFETRRNSDYGDRVFTVSEERQGIFSEIYNQLENLIEGIRESSSSFFTDAEKKKIKQIQNRYSIVFHQVGSSGNLLFLGDISKENYEKHIVLAQNCPPDLLLKGRYRVIKVSHHGTRDYFSSLLPPAKRMIISNKRHSNWEISLRYVTGYPYPEFICTNHDGCEMLHSQGRTCVALKKLLCPYSRESGNYCGFGADPYRDIFLP